MEDPLVSVIIPTYNRAGVIKETINSIINQTYSNFEIIIVDDGSTDNTGDIIKTFQDDRIKYYWKKNTGLPSKARNVGLKHVNGEFIAFLDSDDIWLPKKIETQLFDAEGFWQESFQVAVLSEKICGKIQH